MTLDEVRKELETQSNIHLIFNRVRESQALDIAIKAVKVLQHGRLIGQHYDPALLPGETKD